MDIFDEYRYLVNAIEHFSADLEYTEIEYVDSYRFLIESSPMYVESLKEEIRRVMSDARWSWVSVAKKTKFIGEDDKEDSVFESVKFLVFKPIGMDDIK